MKNFVPFLLFTLILSSCARDQDDILDDISEDPTETLTNATTQLIVDWNELWLELDRHTFGMRPNATARALAYIHLAVYETAVYSMDGYTSNENRLPGLNIDDTQRDATIDLNLAINTTYAKVLDHFMYSVSINKENVIEELETAKAAFFSENLSEDVINSSTQWGNYIAEQVIAYSETDQEAETQIINPQPFSYEPPVGDGYWTYSADAERAWFPYWASARTFVISSEETSSVPPPIDYSEVEASDYYNEMMEVYTVSTSALAEDNEDLWISEFWSDDVEGLMMSPPGRQVSIAKQLVEQFDLDYEPTLALLLRLGFSLNDAAVSSWADKYEYMVMRPSVYIQEFIDAEFNTNLFRFIDWPNPSFPGYPSGHSTFASAAGGLFINQFGDNVDFTDNSHDGRTEFRSTPRQYNTISDMAEENAFSRVPLGVHIRMDCTEGLRLGYEISDAVNNFDIGSSQ